MQSLPYLSQHNIFYIPKDYLVWTWDMEITEHETLWNSDVLETRTYQNGGDLVT